jgi:hypothetical protein
MEELLLVGRFNNLWVKQHVSPFSDKCPGRCSPLLAVIALPIMAAVGMAVDYSRVNAARTAFQSALDATALMLSKDAATASNNALQTEASNFQFAFSPV